MRECECEDERENGRSRAGIEQVLRAAVEPEFNFYKLQTLIENWLEKISVSGSETLSLPRSLAYYLFLYILRICACVCCFSDFRQFVERVFVYCNLTDLFGNPESLLVERAMLEQLPSEFRSETAYRLAFYLCVRVCVCVRRAC